MTQEQFNVLKANLIASGMLAPDASDDAASKYASMLQQKDPDTLEKMMSRNSGWLTLLGIGAGAVAIYLVWSHYSKTKKLGEIERPESMDHRHQLRGFSKSLGKFRGGMGGPSRGGCRAPARRKGLGDADYEFEPEVRLEGHRGGRRTRRAR